MGLSIPILMYHQVVHQPHKELAEWAVTPKAFATQMKILKLQGYKTITLKMLEGYMNKTVILPRKPVIITFDDGCVDVADNAVPVLEENSFTAVFFIPTAFVGKTSVWLKHEFGIEVPIISWGKIKELDSKGFEIGSHAMTHPQLDKLSTADCYNELAGSRKALEDHLDHEVKYLAYPYGLFTEEVKTIAAEAGYSLACSDQPGLTSIKDDPFMLPRMNIGYEDTLLDFEFKIYTAQSAAQFFNPRIRKVKNILRAIKRRVVF